MSISTQQKHMQDIAQLAAKDLGYIHGERESGPNGIKRLFLRKSATFLRALGKDLGFCEMKVHTNPAGIAVSGEVTLMGLWRDGNGLYFQINQPIQPFNSFLYRHISHIKDYSGGPNRWMPCGLFEAGEYERVVAMMLVLREPSEELRHAA